MPVVTRSMKKMGLIIGIDPEDTRWQQLLPEMLEMILEYVNNKSDLLTCRLVNSTWEASATSVIQKRLLGTSTECKWNTFDAPLMPKGFTSLFPRVKIIQPSLEQGLLAVLPKSVVDLVSAQANPIVTRSLALEWRGSGSFPSHELFTAFRIFETYGTILTSLSITCVGLCPKEAIKILGYLDNLVALNLKGVYKFTLPNEDMNPKWESFLPKLTHLYLTQTNQWMCTWLLKHVASQLVSLNVYSCTLQDLASNEDAPPFFEKLKDLRCYLPRKEMLVNVFRAPILERLNLGGYWITFEELSGFINQFSSTLIELELSEDYIAPSRSLAKNLKSGWGTADGVAFPKMMTFTYNFNLQDQDDIRNFSTWQCLKTFFLSKFPNLKVLNLTFRTYHHMEFLEKFEVRELCQRIDIWNFCSGLEMVQTKYYWRNERSCCFRFTREEMEQE